jgi:hypothetical protein
MIKIGAGVRRPRQGINMSEEIEIMRRRKRNGGGMRNGEG